MNRRPGAYASTDMGLMNSPLRILHVEDDVADAELTRDLLETGGIACDLTRVETESGLLTALQQRAFDLVLADYSLPSFDGESALRIVREQHPDLPFIFVSGTMGEEVAIDALKLGATDYVLKTRMSRLVPAVHRALREARERSELRRAEHELRERESKIRRLVDANIVGILISDLKGRIIEANDAFLQMIGYTREDLREGRLHRTELTPPEWRAVSERAVTELATKGVCDLFEKQYLRRDGTRVPVLVAAAAIEGPKGENVAFVLDLTERKRAEEAARRSERELRDVIETIPAIVWVARPDGFIEFANQRWVEYTGISVTLALDSGWHSAIHPEDLNRYRANWRASIAAAAPFEEEVRFRGADGEYRWFMLRGVPLRDEFGMIRKWYGIMTDIEDRKRARQLEADLAHVNRISMLGELAASLSHELKQPIAAAITDAEACLRWLGREQPALNDACEAATAMVHDGKRASSIIDRLRSLYRKAPPERELVDVNDVIREMLLLLRAEAIRYSISMNAELADGLPRITADRVQLQQVFMNLILNGLEAMKDSGGELSVTSQLDDSGQLLISVRDSGVGLPAGKAEQIFSAFFTTKPQGSGMGLTISHSIVESHGGRLWATTNAGPGATFHFTLPVAVAEMKLSKAGA
jgi:PAS domain S-box-containing protein